MLKYNMPMKENHATTQARHTEKRGRTKLTACIIELISFETSRLCS